MATETGARMARIAKPPKPPTAFGAARPQARPKPKQMAAQEKAVKASPTTTLRTGELKAMNQKLVAQKPEVKTGAFARSVSAQIAASVAAANGGGAIEAAQVSSAVLSETFRNNLLKAVAEAMTEFRLTAFFDGVSIHGLSAIGSKGCLLGPRLDPLISAAKSVKDASGVRLEIREAVASGVGSAFETWREGVTVPGLAWYPAFAAWPGAIASPMPNVPMPIGLCLSDGAVEITTADKLAKQISGALPDALKTAAVTAFTDNVAACLAASFANWLISQQVSMVVGSGPVPGFAPPVVNAAPVINGSIIPTPDALFFGGGFAVVMLPMP